MKKYLLLTIMSFLVLLMSSGCGSITVRSSIRPFSPEEAQRYSSIKKIAILPFDNLTKQKDAEKLINALFSTEILERELFESIEDVRYVASVMKMLKIKRTEILDRDLVLKMGETMRCEAIIVGDINAYEVGKKDESTDISVSVTMLDTRSGDILWTANVTNTSSTSIGKVFGVTPGPNHLEMARAVVRKLASSLEDGITNAREEELKMEIEKKYLEEPTEVEEGEEEGELEEEPAEFEEEPAEFEEGLLEEVEEAVEEEAVEEAVEEEAVEEKAVEEAEPETIELEIEE